MKKEKKKMGRGKKILFWLGGIIFIGGLIGSFSDSDTKTPAEPVTAEKQQEQKADSKKKEVAKKAEPKKEEKPKKEEPKKDKPKDEPKPTANMDGYNERINSIIDDSEGIILDIAPNTVSKNYQQMEITVDGNVWENSSETDKIQFSEAAADLVQRALWGYGVLEMGKDVQFTILDQNGYELAKRGILSGKFKIKR